MDRTRNQWLLIGGGTLALLLFLLAAWYWQDQIQKDIIEPTASRVWWWWNFARIAFPQTELWVLLILFGILRLTWFAARRTRLHFPDPPVPQKPGRVGYWLELLNLGNRAQRMFIKPLRFLAVDVIAENEQEDREVIFSRLHRQTLPLPTHLQTYLNMGNPTGRNSKLSGDESTSFPNLKTRLDPEIEEIIEELENIMEIPHDV